MPKSLIELRDWSKENIQKILSHSLQLEESKPALEKKNRVVALIFFESSTRTRLSFEVACHREGYHPLVMASKAGTSIDKGESLEDTLENIRAMQPDLLVVRSGADLNQNLWAQKLDIPFICAGWGHQAHPTQALLDIRSIIKKDRDPSQIKLAIVGDVKHSRVASSHFQLAEKLGYQVGVLPTQATQLPSHILRFTSLEESLSWSNVVMPLRFQVERHSEKLSYEAMTKFQINHEILKKWKPNGLLLHPGPVNYGFELDPDVNGDSRNLILSQVESGVWIRRACLNYLLKEAL